VMSPILICRIVSPRFLPAAYRAGRGGSSSRRRVAPCVWLILFVSSLPQINRKSDLAPHFKKG
jgi:hypothetical protein